MLRRRAAFLHVDETEPSMTTLGLVRDFVGRGYVPVMVVGPGTDVMVDHTIRERTGAPLTAPLVLDGRFAPDRIWAFARSFDLDLARSVLVASTPSLDGLFSTAGLGRILRPAEARLAA